MKFTLFVTCSRGLDAFVKEEIFEKIPGVSDVHSLDEGKVVFSLQTLHPEMTNNTSDHCFPNKYQDTRGVSYGIKLKEEMFLSIEALLPVYKLKLIERVFLLLFCEEIGLNYVDETKMISILEKTDLNGVADLVSKLKNRQKQLTENQTLCCKPNSCPGLMNRIVGKEETRQKRQNILSSRSLLANLKKEKCLKRKSDFDLQEELCLNKKDSICFSPTENKNSEMSCYNIDHVNLDSIAYEEIRPDMEKASLQKSYLPIQKVEENSDKISPGFVNHNVTQPKNEEKLLDPNAGVQSLSGNVKNSDISKTIGSSEDKVHKCISQTDFRISCRIRGKHKSVLTSDWLTRNFINIMANLKCDWVVDWTDPVLDFYVNITDLHLILGVTLSKESLSLRPYISHITLRSTTSYLMVKLSSLLPGDFLLDPMCGGGTILAEAAKCFNVGQVIGSDLSGEQLEVARCNLQSLGVPFSLILSHAAKIPLKSGAINAVTCDFPFGQKHKLTRDNETLLLEVLGESCRVLVTGGRAVFLLSSEQHKSLKQNFQQLKSHTKIISSNSQLDLESSYPLSLGRTMAYIVVLLKR